MASNQPVHRYPYTYSGSKRSSNYQYSKSEEADRNAFSTPVNCPLPNGDLWFEVIWDGYKAFLENKVAAPSNPASPPRLGGSSKGDGDHLPKVSLKGNLSFEDQVIDIVKQIELTKEDYEDYTLALNDIYDVFYKDVPGLVPIVYGSVLSTLAMRGSDLDVLLFSRQVVIPADFIKTQHHNKFPRTYFSNTLLIRNALVPIFKVIHTPTQIELDISTHSMGVCNSLLVRYLTTAVPKFKITMLVITYIFKKNSQFKESSRITTFTLVLMFIFFLQNLEDPLVVPLHRLLGKTPMRPWPFMVLENNPVPPEYKSNHSFLFLIREFFSYYSTFDFQNNIISTFLGKTIPINDFINLNNLDSAFDPYIETLHMMNPIKKNCVLYVQEPVELYKLTSRSALPSNLASFIELCKKVVKLLPSGTETFPQALLETLVAPPQKKRKTLTFTSERPFFFNPEVFKDRLPGVFENILFCKIEVKKETLNKDVLTLNFDLQIKIDMFQKPRIFTLKKYLAQRMSIQRLQSQIKPYLINEKPKPCSLTITVTSKRIKLSIDPKSDVPDSWAKKYGYGLINNLIPLTMY